MVETFENILIVGPASASGSRVYGGGAGGYSRNMSVYLSTLKLPGYKLVPFYHSVRGQSAGVAENPIVRLMRDTSSFIVTCLRLRPSTVHVLAQYRGALPRELAFSLVCRILRIRLVYDIKAGAFGQSYRQGGRVYKAMTRSVVHSANCLFAEGEKTRIFLRSEFGLGSVFFPNFIPDSEIPSKPSNLFAAVRLRILFVGYCYRDKGIFELVEGCRVLASMGHKIVLKIIGAESPEFTEWCDELPNVDSLDIIRCGQRPSEEVLNAMQESDVYAYPTSHPGEGHNNSINEAMMNGLVVLTTRHGFLEDVLGVDGAFFLDKVAPDQIAAALEKIKKGQEEAKLIAGRACNRFLSEFTATQSKNRFLLAYQSILDNTEPSQVSE